MLTSLGRKIIKHFKFFHVNRNYGKLIKENSILKDKYNDNSCFVVGNGSSLNSMDLKKLKNEYVFVMNNFFVHKDLEIIKPSFYCNLEPLDSLYKHGSYFHPKNYYKEADKALKNIDIEMFFGIDAQNFIENNGFFKNKDIYYLQTDKDILRSEKLEDDISKPYSFGDGAMYSAICICAYMGFDKIFFIGCDCDWFSKKRVTRFYDGFHQYQELEGLRNEILLYNNYITLKKWRIVTEHFKNKGIKIYNAGVGGDNDTCERVDFSRLING